jgi:hypothetical protein
MELGIDELSGLYQVRITLSHPMIFRESAGRTEK